MLRHAPDDYVCPFCLLAHGTFNDFVLSNAADVVCRSPHVTAFVGSHQWPNNAGNILVIPNQHFENIFDLPLDLASDLHRVVRAAAFALKDALRCEGVSTRQHNEPAGNQDVWHYHIHVTPRYGGDNFYGTTRQPMEAVQRAEYAAQLRAVWHLE